MRKLSIVLIGFVFICFSSCENAQNDSSAVNDNRSNNDQESNSSPLGRDLSEAEKNGMRLLKRRKEAKKNADSVQAGNTTSTYRYLVSSDDYPIFTVLLKESSLSKHVHANSVTVLAPVDLAFEGFPEYKQLLMPGNEALLDEFISYHVINTSLEYKQFSEGSSWEVHAGENLELSRDGGINFNGAHVRSGEIETDKGSIIGMDELIHMPQLSK